MHAIILSKLYGDHTALSFSLFSLSFLSLLLALLFQLSPSLSCSLQLCTTLAASVFGKSLSDLRCLECLVLADVLKSCWASAFLNVRPVHRAFTAEKLLLCFKTGSKLCVCTIVRVFGSMRKARECELQGGKKVSASVGFLMKKQKEYVFI